MRYAPVSLALSLLAGVTASVSYSSPPVPLDPRAAALETEGRRMLTSGNLDGATDAFEAALAVQPGSGQLVMDLAEVARRQGMPGKALHYYREVLDRDPENVFAIAGEGGALVDKGALEKARRNLARLESLCGDTCDATRQLASTIERGTIDKPAEKMVSADAVKAQPEVSAN